MNGEWKEQWINTKHDVAQIGKRHYTSHNTTQHKLNFLRAALKTWIWRVIEHINPFIFPNLWPLEFLYVNLVQLFFRKNKDRSNLRLFAENFHIKAKWQRSVGQKLSLFQLSYFRLNSNQY
jgi:hypothetical protein